MTRSTDAAIMTLAGWLVGFLDGKIPPGHLIVGQTCITQSNQLHYSKDDQTNEVDKHVD